MDLLDRCLARPGKNFGPGYGFAIAYLDDHLNPAHLRDAAIACVGFAYGTKGTAEDRKSDDLVGFVIAYSEAEMAEDFMIEGAQLILRFALAGHDFAVDAMRLLGHPGY